jgi:hypothetical protein
LATHREEDSWQLTGRRILGHSQGRGFLATHREEDSWPITGKGLPVTNREEYSWPLTRKRTPCHSLGGGFLAIGEKDDSWTFSLKRIPGLSRNFLALHPQDDSRSLTTNIYFSQLILKRIPGFHSVDYTWHLTLKKIPDPSECCLPAHRWLISGISPSKDSYPPPRNGFLASNSIMRFLPSHTKDDSWPLTFKKIPRFLA